MNPLSERLRSRREELTLSVREISARTRIRPNVINALEEGHFDILPRVYITSFIKNYGALLEIPEEELEELWIASGLDIPPQESVNYSQPKLKSTNSNSPVSSTTTYISGNTIKPKDRIKPVQASPKFIRLLVFSALFLGISAVGYYFLFREAPKTPRRAGELVPPSDIRDSNEEGGLLNQLFDEPTKDSIILEATATDSVWLTMNADGKKSDQLLMTPGMQRRWSAKTQFILSLGNAGALDLKRNNVPLAQLGKKGTALRYVKITENEVNTSSSPYRNIDSLAKLSALAAEKRAAAKKLQAAKNEQALAKQATAKSSAKTKTPLTQTNSKVQQTNNHKLLLKKTAKESRRSERRKKQPIPITPAPIQPVFKSPHSQEQPPHHL